jgi:hypothetical protein
MPRGHGHSHSQTGSHGIGVDAMATTSAPVNMRPTHSANGGKDGNSPSGALVVER